MQWLDKKIPHYYCSTCEAEFAEEERARLAREDLAREIAGIPPLYRTANITDFDAGLFKYKTKDANGEDVYVSGAHEALMQWVNKPRGVLYLYGDCGVGKTHLTCAIKRKLNIKRVSNRLIFANEMFLDIRGTFGNKTKDREKDIIRKYLPDNNGTVVIIDDLGVQKTGDYVTETWTAIIDRLYRQSNPLFVSTNYPLKELGKKELLGDRIASRLASGIVIKLDGKDRRIKEHWTSCWD